MRTTKSQEKYWKNRKIDWKKEYFDTWKHPHRYLITAMLKQFSWHSLFEVGVGGGPNLVNIITYIKGKQVGGCDINQDAIDMCNKEFKGGVFKLGPAYDLFMSDKSCDVILSDMTMIYIGPRYIHKTIKELRRVTRKEIILCELVEENPLKRLWLYLKEGYFFYNYPKLLKKYGFYNIIKVKIPPEVWGGLQGKYAYLIRAKSPKHYV